MTSPSRSLPRAIALFAAACALTLTGTATAHAQTWTHTDPAGDVVAFDFETEEEAPAPTQERGDVRRVRVTHNDRRVVVRFSMRKALAGDRFVFYSIRTPRGQFELSRMWISGTTQVELRKEGRGRTIRCSGLKWDIDRERATVAVSIPRWCVSRPRWVRVGIGVATMPASGGAASGTLYADDALRRGIGEDVRRSPRVYRG